MAKNRLAQLNFDPNDSEHIELRYGNRLLLTRKQIIVRAKSGRIESFSPAFDKNTITAQLGSFGCYTETLQPLSNQAVGKIKLKITSDEPFVVYCPFSLPRSARPPYFMIPGFLYGSNNLKGSTGADPKFDYGGPVGWPKTSLVYTRSDRSTHPGVITLKDDLVFLVGIKEKLEGAAYQTVDHWEPGFPYTGLMLDTSQTSEDIIGFTLGYEHKPKRYGWLWDEPRTPRDNEYLFGWIKELKGKTLTTQTFYFADSAEGIPDSGKAIRAYYYKLHQPVMKRTSRKDAMQLISKAIVEDGWNSERKFFFLCDDKGGRLIGDAAWTGGMQVAYPLLASGIRLNDMKLRDVAIEFINNLADNAVNEKAGLLYEEYRDDKWQITGWWGTRKDCLDFSDKPLHCAYINGQASYFLLKSYEVTARQYPNWLKTAKIVIETAIKSQNHDGAYASFFDPNNGTGVVYDAFQSCWFVPGAAILAKITGDAGYLESAKKALRHYHAWHKKGELYGTPMDTHNAVDEEGNLAFICGCAELHKITGDDEFLALARAGLDWEFSWKFAYNTAHTNDPLKSMNWSSCGGSITSTHNPHIHPMGNLVAGELYYFYTQTKDKYIADRLTDTCIWGLGTFNRFDGEFGFGKAGQATEQFFHTDAILLPWWRPWDGGIWEAYLPWAPACVLLSCAEGIPDSFFGE